MEDHYEINVSKDGKHLFATAPRSCLDHGDFLRVYHEIQTRFPEFTISVTKWRCRGELLHVP